MNFKIVVHKIYVVDTDDLDQEAFAAALQDVTGREDNEDATVPQLRSALETMLGADLRDVIDLDDISDMDIIVEAAK